MSNDQMIKKNGNNAPECSFVCWLWITFRQFSKSYFRRTTPTLAMKNSFNFQRKPLELCRCLLCMLILRWKFTCLSNIHSWKPDNFKSIFSNYFTYMFAPNVIQSSNESISEYDSSNALVDLVACLMYCLWLMQLLCAIHFTQYKTKK